LFHVKRFLSAPVPDRAKGVFMANANGPAIRPEDGTPLPLDIYVLRFEKAWENGEPPAIDTFLPDDGPERLAVLRELIHVDVENSTNIHGFRVARTMSPD
jgi:hypothetical protein